MDPVQTLIDRAADSSKRIAVIGDAMIDEWVYGTPSLGQEGCLLFPHERVIARPGGAANAVRQLDHWNAVVDLISPVTRDCPFSGVLTNSQQMPIKRRYVAPDGRIVFRCDPCDRFVGDEKAWRDEALEFIRTGRYDAVLLSDYDKGFLDIAAVLDLISLCRQLGIPVVADAKRDPMIYDGALIKANKHYADKHHNNANDMLVTNGGEAPILHSKRLPFFGQAVQCRNHVGAGDCYAAHLTLALAHGLLVEDAAVAAHAAARVYVQHDVGRPPWPHEVGRDMDPIVGKILLPIFAGQMADLRESLAGKRVIFTNGVFRIPHAGHAWLLRWARAIGDVLVVAVNDDESSKIAKGPENFVLPVQERTEWLCGLQAVDWVIPFPYADPVEIIRHLRPDVLVKGYEYSGRRVPGDDLVKEVLFAPPDAYARHCTDLVDEVKGR